MIDREAHLRGLLRFVAAAEKAQVKRWIEAPSGRTKLLARLSHQIELDRRFANEPPKGQRDPMQLLSALRKLGAPAECYVIAADGNLDDTFQDLENVVLQRLSNFSHGTVLSAIPGRLALFRTAFPHRHFIVHRAD